MLSLIQMPTRKIGGVSPMRKTNYLLPTKELFASPFEEVFDKFWTEFFTRPGLKQSLVAKGNYPRLNIYRKQDGSDLVCEATVPGLKKEDVSIEVEHGYLVITGKSCSDSEKSEKMFYLKELRESSFRRSIALPEGYEIKEENITAEMKDGILTVVVTDFFPEDKPKQVPEKVTIPIK